MAGQASFTLSVKNSVELASYVATTIVAIVTTYYAYLTRKLVVVNKNLVDFNLIQLESNSGRMSIFWSLYRMA